jgi:hypothetical protein
MSFDSDSKSYTYDCRCGSEFLISFEDFCNGYNVIECFGCSLKIKII